MPLQGMLTVQRCSLVMFIITEMRFVFTETRDKARQDLGECFSLHQTTDS